MPSPDPTARTPAALQVHPLTPARWADLEALFATRGCAQARACWCMYYRLSGPGSDLSGASQGATLRQGKLKALVDAGRPPGLIGYRDGVPVGWVSLGPREDFAKLARSPVMKAVDAQPVWSVICFVVPPQFRGQGVARALLDGAIRYAASQGARLIEAYPVDKPERTDPDGLWFGAKAMYDAAGFFEVARRKPERPVVRLKTGPMC